MMKWQFKALNSKLDNLLESSKTSSRTEYSYEFVKSLIETFTKDHAKSLDSSTKAVENSEKTVREATKNVEKVANDVTEFMVDFRRSSDKSTKAANKFIAIFGTTLQTEKVALSKVRTKI